MALSCSRRGLWSARQHDGTGVRRSIDRLGASRPKRDRGRSEEYRLHQQCWISRAPHANRATIGSQGKFALCGVIGEVKRLFEIGSLTEMFLICQTQADGIAKLRQ
jgi:hypothetical protein